MLLRLFLLQWLKTARPDIVPSFQRRMLSHLRDIRRPLLDHNWQTCPEWCVQHWAARHSTPSLWNSSTTNSSSSRCSALPVIGSPTKQVKLGSTTPGSWTISTGVPQGSVLSPPPFSLYTNDCNSGNTSVKFLKYADSNKFVYRQEVEQLV